MLGTCLYIKSINQKRFRGRISTRSFFVFLIPSGIGIWKCWFLRRGENRSTRRKTSQSHKKGPTTNSTHLWRPRQHWDPRLIGGRRVLHHCTILVHSWPLTSAKMLFTTTKQQFPVRSVSFAVRRFAPKECKCVAVFLLRSQYFREALFSPCISV